MSRSIGTATAALLLAGYLPRQIFMRGQAMSHPDCRATQVQGRPASLGQEGEARARHACRRAVLSAHRPQRRLEQEHRDGHRQGNSAG